MTSPKTGEKGVHHGQYPELNLTPLLLFVIFANLALIIVDAPAPQNTSRKEGI